MPVPKTVAASEVTGQSAGQGDAAQAAWAEHLVSWQRTVIRDMVRGAPLATVLTSLCNFGEDHLPGRLFSILLYDPNNRKLLFGAAPTLPRAYNEAIHGLAIGPAVGSCGTAAHDRRQVIVEDIATDPKWKDFLPLAREHGLGACWSTPIFATDGELLGTWAVYLRTPGGPTERDLQVIEVATELAALAIERDDDERALQKVLASRETERASLKALFSQFPGPLAILRGADFTVALANDAYIRLIGGRAEIVGKPLREALPELDASGVFEILETAYRTGLPQTVQEFAAPVPDGRGGVRHGWFTGTTQPLRDADGKVEGVVTAGYEVTDQVKARQRVEELLEDLRVSEDRLRLAVEATRLATWDYDPRSDRATWNDRAYELFGVRPGTPPTFATLTEHIHPEDREKTLQRWRESTDPKGEGSSLSEFRLLRSDGSVRWVEVRRQVFLGAEGKPVRIIGTALDVTDRVAAEQDLRTANERLERLGRIKTEFLNMASHELRTPLTPLLLRLQMLGRHSESMGERGRRDLEVVLRNAERLADLVTDVLEVARLESGHFPVRAEPLDLDETVAELVQTFEPVAKERGLRILHRADGRARMIGDSHRLGQVVTNLLDNAIKYTPRGGMVTVRTSSDGDWSMVEVADTGPGLSRDQLGQLFEPFRRVHEGLDAGPPGSGLGLFIARAIVEQHGGTISAHSDGAGKGAQFIVRLPVQPPASFARSPGGIP